MRYTSSLLLSCGVLLTSGGAAAEESRGTAAFHGVKPGVTTVKQLQENPVWGRPKKTERHFPNVHWLYRIKPWQTVVAIVDEGEIVQAIDLIPPVSFDHLEKIATGLGVGPFQRVGALPLGADCGTRPTSDSVVLVSKISYVAAIVNETDGQQHVERIRFYHPETLLSGITPGKTTLQEVRLSKRWGASLKSTPLIGKASAFEFLRPRWKVTLTVEEDIVWTIDVIPFEPTDADHLAAKVNLGMSRNSPPSAIDSKTIPPWLRLAPSPPPNTTVVEYPDRMAVMFVAERDDERIAERLRFYADVPERPSYLGIHMRLPSPVLLAQFNRSPDFGVEVTYVAPGSAASAAAISRGDVLFRIDGREFTSASQFSSLIRGMPLGSTHRFTIGRKGKLLTTAVTFTPVTLSQAFLTRGMDTKLRGDLLQAIPDFDQCLRLAPENASAYEMRGDCRLQMQDLEGAIDDFTQAIRYDKNMIGPYINRAVAHLRNGNPAASMNDCNETIRLDPSFALGYMNRGVIHGEWKEYDLALKDYSQAITLDPALILAYRNRAGVHRVLGNEELADADLRQADELEAAAQKGK